MRETVSQRCIMAYACIYYFAVYLGGSVGSEIDRK